MNLKDVIIANSTLNENSVLYAKKINGQLLPYSEIVLLELSDVEQNKNTNDVSNVRCPGFTYCIEMFLIQDLMRDLDEKNIEMDKKIARVIYYIEHDA